MRPELIEATNLLHRNTPEAVEQAIGLLQNTVYSFSMKVCGHPHDAEDTMPEVLYRSLGHLAKMQDPQALAIWLYTVTRNRCWRMRRKSANAPRESFSPVKIGRKTCVCPVRSVGIGRSRSVISLKVSDQSFLSWGPYSTKINDMRFSHYHVFRSESRILTGFKPTN